jgi:hypothetical protein
MNQIAPGFEGTELGIGESLLMKAIADATGRTMDSLKSSYNTMGDLGKVALVYEHYFYRSNSHIGQQKYSKNNVCSLSAYDSNCLQKAERNCQHARKFGINNKYQFYIPHLLFP